MVIVRVFKLRHGQALRVPHWATARSEALQVAIDSHRNLVVLVIPVFPKIVNIGLAAVRSSSRVE
jgi:hypothetical protein